MSPRWPPILGVTGFDFGEKPAISLALSRKKEAIKQEWNTPVTGQGPTGTCPEITLLCDSVTASKIKCGTVGLVEYDPPNYYQDAAFWSIIHLPAETKCANYEHFEEDEEGNCVRTTTHEPNGFRAQDCNEECPVIDNYTDGIPYGGGATDTDWSEALFGGNSINISLSNEYTTEMLITDTEAALPAFSGAFDCGATFAPGQGCTCEAVRNMSSDEASYGIQDFQYKFTFPSGNNFRLDWVERFVPDAGDPVDTPMTESFSSADDESAIYTVLHPDTNGTISIADIVCTPL